MKTVILVILVVFSLSVGLANAQASRYHAPAYDFNQNNWMSGGD